MFFEKRIQSSSKHRRLRYLWLLALRIALLALLSLLFANPFINRAATAIPSRKLTVIAIDRSFSMRFQNRLAAAKTEATQFANRLAGQPAVQVVALDTRTTNLTQPETDRNAINDAIATIEPTDESSSYGEFSRAMRVLEQATGLSLDVHLFTDAQQTSMPTAFADLQVGLHTSLTIHQIGTGDSSNWSVQSVNVPGRIFDNSNVRLITQVSGWQTQATTRQLSVLLDGKSIASKSVTIPASGQAEMEFNDLVIPYGVHRGELRMEPHDELPNDDAFPFSIERADPRKVLFLHGPGSSTESFFYKSALDASPATGLRLQAQQLGQASNLDLSQYAFIVLNNPGDLDAGTSQRLTDYVSRGGALFISVGPATQRAGIIPLTGEKISETTMLQTASETRPSDIVDGHAFDNVQFPAAARITPKQEDRMLARFADGTPLLLEQKQGEGKVLILAATLDNSTSDFPLHASFLPFVAATGAYLSGSGGDPSSIVVGSAISLRQSQAQNASADVVGPSGKHEISLSDAKRAMVFNPVSEGFYDVHRASGMRVLIAAHADRRESNLAKIPDDVLNLWRNTGRDSPLAPETGTSTNTVPFSLWRYVLTFVLIAAIVESIFATRYLTGERQAT